MSRPDTSPCPDPSDAGYRRHLYRWEWPCQPCTDAHNAYERSRRVTAPARRRELSPHGTPARYRWHKRRGEAACEACLVAHRGQWKPKYAANRKARRRAARSGSLSDAPSDGAQVLPGSPNRLGDDLLALSLVHGLDNEPVDLAVPAVADGDCAGELGHDGHLLVCHSEHAPSGPDSSPDQHQCDLTPVSVTARILGSSPTTSRLASTADTGRRHTNPCEREGAMRTLRAAMPPAQNLGGAA